eukprot:scaffold39228_cov199-Amphora_coffeaeformis.AAC.2
MVSKVVFWNRVRSICWMKESDWVSTDAVASSKTSTRGSSTIARARHNNCLSPTLKFDPPSSTGSSRIASPRSAAPLWLTAWRASNIFSLDST